MNLNDLYARVSQNTDTSGTQINAAETSRVCSELFKVLASLPADECLKLVAHGLELARNK